MANENNNNNNGDNFIDWDEVNGVIDNPEPKTDTSHIEGEIGGVVMLEHTNEWVYFGDVNPVEHGGIWIREQGDEGEDFDYVKVQEWFDDHIAVSTGTVCITDSWIDWEAVESYGDVNGGDDTHRFVATIVDYYGIGEFDSAPDYIPVDGNTEGKVRAFLDGQGITF